jgi:hypothetical protein
MPNGAIQPQSTTFPVREQGASSVDPTGDQQSTVAEVAVLKNHINLTTWLQQQEAQAMAARTQAALKAGEAKINMYA